MIAWKMWTDRNRRLHETEQGEEIQHMNEAITREYEVGRSTLTSKYAYLITSNLDTLLTQDVATKKKKLLVLVENLNQTRDFSHSDDWDE